MKTMNLTRLAVALVLMGLMSAPFASAYRSGVKEDGRTDDPWHTEVTLPDNPIQGGALQTVFEFRPHAIPVGVEVRQVPIPAAALLFGPGLGVLIGLSQWLKNKHKP